MGCTGLHFHQCYMKMAVFPASSTALLVTQFLIFTNRIGEKWYHSAVLICISVIMSEVKELFINLKAAADRTKAQRLRWTTKKRGQEELPLTQGQGQRPTPPGCNRAGAAGRRFPMFKEQRLHGRRRAKRSYSTFKVRRGSREEIPLVQGKRNLRKMVGVVRGHQRAGTLKP